MTAEQLIQRIHRTHVEAKSGCHQTSQQSGRASEPRCQALGYRSRPQAPSRVCRQQLASRRGRFGRRDQQRPHSTSICASSRRRLGTTTIVPQPSSSSPRPRSRPRDPAGPLTTAARTSIGEPERTSSGSPMSPRERRSSRRRRAGRSSRPRLCRPRSKPASASGRRIIRSASGSERRQADHVLGFLQLHAPASQLEHRPFQPAPSSVSS